MNEVGSNEDHLLIVDNCCGFSPLYSCYLLVVNTPLASCTASKALNLMYSLTSSCFCKSQIVVLATFPTHKQKEIVCVSSILRPRQCSADSAAKHRKSVGPKIDQHTLGQEVLVLYFAMMGN